MKNDNVNMFEFYPVRNHEEHIKALLLGLVEFIHILRRLGIRTSVAEARDALEALSRVDLLDRDQVKVALSATLVKNHYDRRAFDLAFEAFFVPPEVREERMEQKREKLAGNKDGLPDAECGKGLFYKETPNDEQLVSSKDEPGDKLVKAIKEDKRNWGKEFLDLVNVTVQHTKDMPMSPSQAKKRFIEVINRMQDESGGPSVLVARTVESSLKRWRGLPPEEIKNKRMLSIVDKDPTGSDELDDVVETVALGLSSEGEEDSVLYEDMKKIDDKDLARTILLIRKMSQQLATRISRRYYRKKRRGRLDMRRTIRKNISLGGALIDLKYHTRRRQKPRIVLVCDVSGSMARYAVFVLQFIYGLSSVVKDIESFVFSEELERVSSYFKRNEGFARTMSSLIGESHQWARGTNLYVSLKTLLTRHRRLLAPDVFVIMVSDAQTVQPHLAAGQLKETRGKVRDVIWLNTMPREEWPRTLAITDFQKHCRMFECSTIDQLNRVLGHEMTAV